MARPAVQAAVRRARIDVSGAVQGVGFRPYVYRLATALELGGWVRNTPRGVQIEADGDQEALDALLDGLRAAPAPARVDAIDTDFLPSVGVAGFTVAASQPGAGPALPLPDLAVCADCLADIRDPAGRRHDYAFTSCSRCGPRYSIVAGLPYDRSRTAMAGFSMCPACAAEYADPADRRFHHQANACPACGPRLSLEDATGRALAHDSAALDAAADCLRAGGIVALMGIGGFQLLVDGRDESAVARLRARKRRPDKPFAVMFPDVEAVQAACLLMPDERALLAGPAAPIVLLARRDDRLAPSVAPGQPRLGVLLPYSPLHALLMERLDFPVIATSGNRAGEPLCTTIADAQARLADIADVFLVHDRPILRALDDSLVQVAAGRAQVLRLARGYAPLAVNCPEASEPVLALGGHLKGALAVGGEGRIVLGQHLGDLDNSAALAGFDAAARDTPALAGVRPARLACDAHPDYASSQRAAGFGLPVQRVQHHHAHVAAVMAEHGLGGEALGVAFDGAGLGSDGTLWGGEFLLASRQHFRRIAWLRPFPLPGGDQAAREPRRAALGLLYARFGADLDGLALPPLQAFTAGERRTLLSAVERGINTPLTSSVGRLFDAVAALLGLCQRASFEGQAALALQAAAEAVPPQAPYPLPLVGVDADFSVIPAQAGVLHPVHAGATVVVCDPQRGLIADWQPLLDALLADLAAGVPTPRIAGRFHAALAALVVTVATQVGARQVALAGGCFQNRLLLELTAARLADAGVAVFWAQRVPPGDGGLALGQAAVCAADVPASACLAGQTA